MFLLGEARFGLAQIEHVVGPFDALDGAIDKFTRAAGVFVVDGLAFGLAHLLKNYLLGGLSGDAAQGVGVLGDADFSSGFGGRIDAARFGESHLMSRILNGLDGFLDSEELNAPVLGSMSAT